MNNERVKVNPKRLEKTLTTKGKTPSWLRDQIMIGERSFYRWKQKGFPYHVILAMCFVLETTPKYLTGGRR